MLSTMSITSRTQGANFAEDLFRVALHESETSLQTKAVNPVKSDLLARALSWLVPFALPLNAGRAN